MHFASRLVPTLTLLLALPLFGAQPPAQKPDASAALEKNDSSGK
jgi:hypothetical protein